MKEGDWIDTKDGQIVEVRAETGSFVCGKEVVFNTFDPLHYGEDVIIEKKELKNECLL